MKISFNYGHTPITLEIPSAVKAVSLKFESSGNSIL